MSEIRPGVRRLFRWPFRRPGDVRAEVDEEIRLHLELRTEQLVARGLPPAAARAEAERRFGPLDEARARLHRSARRREGRLRAWDWADALRLDLRFALRALRRAPGFAAVAVLSLALGIGANTAVFGLINAVMLRALPVRHPEELVTLGQDAKGAGVFTNPIWEALRDRQDAFDGALAYSEGRFNLADAGEERRVLGLSVSGDFFSVLGVPAALGRPLVRGDDVRGCPPVAALGHRFWRTTLGGDPSVVGRTLRLEGKPVQIVGVVDPRFAGLEAGRDVQVYLPLCADAALSSGGRSFLDARSTWVLRIVGRPRAGLTVAQVNARLAAVAPAVYRATVPNEFPAELQRRYLEEKLVAVPSLETLSGLRATYARPLVVLLAVAALVLLVACANVANLVRARGAARGRELAVRVALGGGRGRLVRQLFAEGLLLSGAGAALGLAVAYGGGRLLVALLSTSEEAVRLDLAPDLRVLGFTAALGVATALLFSLAPAWPATRVDPQAAMKAQARGVVGRPARFGAGRLLVVGQIAVSLVLVSGAALLLGSFRALTRLDPGFRAEQVLVVHADLRLPPDAGAARTLALRRALLDGLRALPGVERAAGAFTTPIGGGAWNGAIAVVGGPAPSPDRDDVYFNAVTDDYFAALSMPLAAGRAFTPDDGPAAPRVAVVNETLARRYFAGQNPIGQRFRLVAGEPVGDPVQIVGVVRDAKYTSLRGDVPPTAFVALDQDSTFGRMGLNLVVRGAGPPEGLAAGVRRVFRDVAPRATLQLTAMDRRVAESLTRDRLLATLSAFFGGLALLLATVGLYGTVSYAVTRRRGELGVRLALGAGPARVRRLVLGDVGRIVAAGLALGALGTLAATRLVAGFLYGLTPRDPATLAGSALALGAAAALAGYLPARRAARTDPVAALREE